MNKKKWIMIALTVICVVIAVIFWQQKMGDSAGKKSASKETSQTENGSDSTNNSKNTSSSDKNSGNASSNTERGSGNSGSSNSGSTKNSTTAAEKKSSTTASTIPGEVGNTGIVVKKLNGYSGVYVEDGTNKKVSNVSTILVKNKTGKAIQYAKLIFKVSGGKEAVFSLSNIPKDAEVMVFEQSKLKYKKKSKYTLKNQTVALLDEMPMMKDDIGISRKKDDSITVTNKTKKDIKSLRLFYKYKYKDGTYVGGITFTARLENVKAGESRNVRPNHFDYDGSEILMVGQYDE